MKFKTTIKLVTEAKDKNEAMEIAGEYLSGNLATGVDMKFCTAPERRDHQFLACIIMVVLAVGIFAIRFYDAKHVQSFTQNFSGDSALQSPLKTSGSYLEFSNFKQEWQLKRIEETLSFIKK
jgi:hypothetical protein